MIEMNGCASREQAARLANMQPKASIEAVITPAAAIMVADAFKSGQTVMLEGYGGPWLITRMETVGGQDSGTPPITRVWGAIADDVAQYEWPL